MTSFNDHFNDARLARLNGLDLAYRFGGDGAPLLLLHPIGLDSSWWQPLAARLAQHFCVLAPDFRGHGGSAPIRAEVELADLADDAADLLRFLGLPSAQVVGLSMGGMAAQHLAIRHPDRIRSLSLLGTACTIPDEVRPGVAERGELARQKGMNAVLESTLERWFSPSALQSRLAESCRQKLLETDAQSWAWCWRAISRLDTLPLLQRISAPTLVVTGTQDVSAPPAAATLITRNIAHARLEIIDGAPHMGPFELPERYMAPVIAFIQNCAS